MVKPPFNAGVLWSRLAHWLIGGGYACRNVIASRTRYLTPSEMLSFRVYYYEKPALVYHHKYVHHGVCRVDSMKCYCTKIYSLWMGTPCKIPGIWTVVDCTCGDKRFKKLPCGGVCFVCPCARIKLTRRWVPEPRSLRVVLFCVSLSVDNQTERGNLWLSSAVGRNESGEMSVTLYVWTEMDEI